MRNPTNYKDHPFGAVQLGRKIELKELPSPDTLAAAEKTRKVTLAMSEQALAFFKHEAARLGMPYQVMIRRLLDDYSSQHTR